MIVNYVFHVTHDFGISTLGHAGLLVDGLCILLEHSGWLRVEDEWDCQKALKVRQYFYGMAVIR